MSTVVAIGWGFGALVAILVSFWSMYVILNSINMGAAWALTLVGIFGVGALARYIALNSGETA